MPICAIAIKVNIPQGKEAGSVSMMAKSITQTSVGGSLSDPIKSMPTYISTPTCSIEFLFRDAKQFAGFNHCQDRDANKFHFHFNLSLATINLARIEMRQHSDTPSFSDFARKAYNQRCLQWLFDKLSLKAEFDLNQPVCQQTTAYGLLHH